MMKTVRISMKKNTILEEMFFGLCKASEIAIIIMITTTTCWRSVWKSCFFA
jgi:hypothetical protein